MTPRTLAFSQLLVLTAAHFVVDMLTGLLPGFLPVLREQFSLSIGGGVLLLTLCAFTANTFQLAAGAIRKNSTRPLLIPIGLGLVGTISLTGVVENWPGAVYWLFLLSFLIGVGAALLHPEGLRGVCGIDSRVIPPATATSVFMLFGFMGYAAGPFLGGALVEWKGFASLWLLWLVVLPLIVLSLRSGIRLATRPPAAGNTVVCSRLTFGELFWVAVFINTGCNVVSGLLPSWLNLLGFSLMFGGGSAMLFGMGAGFGALGMSFLIRRYDPIRCVCVALMAGVGLLLLYFFLIESGRAVALALLAGLGCGAGFPQLVVLARQAKNGPSIGMRMGVIVGGSWGVAGVIFLLVGQLADWIGLGWAMLTAPLSFAVAALLLWNLRYRHELEAGRTV